MKSWYLCDSTMNPSIYFPIWPLIFHWIFRCFSGMSLSDPLSSPRLKRNTSNSSKPLHRICKFLMKLWQRFLREVITKRVYKYSQIGSLKILSWRNFQRKHLFFSFIFCDVLPPGNTSVEWQVMITNNTFASEQSRSSFVCLSFFSRFGVFLNESPASTLTIFGFMKPKLAWRDLVSLILKG